MKWTPKVMVLVAVAACSPPPPNAAAKLAFIVQPQSTYANVALAPAIQVAFVDANGEVVTGETESISIGLANGVNVSGTTVVAAVDGVASFSDLRIAAIGEGFILEAAASVLPHSASDGFDITLGPPSPDQSTLTLSPASAPADGITPITAAVTIRSEGGLVMPDQEVTIHLSGTGGDAFPVHGKTNATGEFVAQLTSIVAETKLVSASTASVELEKSADFTPAHCALRFPGAPKQVFPDPMQSIFVADFDGDGHSDVAAATTSQLTILRGTGSGGWHEPFAYPAPGIVQITGGDLNGDGSVDLVAITSDQKVVLFENQGTGQFAQPTSIDLPELASSITVADFNKDTHLDLALRSNSSILIALGHGDGSFQPFDVYALGFVFSIVDTRIAAADLDGDTYPDIVTLGSNFTVTTLLSNHDGTLKAPTHLDAGDAEGKFAIADLDGDHVLDVVLPTGNGVLLAHGNGDGTLSLHYPTVGIGRVELVAVADWNNDGAPDVAAMTYPSGGNAYEIRLYLGSAGGFLAPKIYGVSWVLSDMTVADLDANGRPDLLLAEGRNPTTSGHTLSVMLGSSVDVLSQPVIGDTGPLAGAYTPVVGDFNGDNFPDLVGRGFAAGWRVMLGSATGWTPAATSSSETSAGTAVGDFDNDTKLDLVVSVGTSIRWLHGNGDGTLQAPITSNIGIGTNPPAVRSGDFDKDGKLDLVLVDNISSSIAVAFGNGDGTFDTAVTYSLVGQPRDVETADLDGDGYLDLVVVLQASSQIAVLKNLANGTFDLPLLTTIVQSPWMTTAGDFDGDGKLDIAMACEDTKVVVLKGKGDLTFEPPVTIDVPFATDSIGNADLDNDGTLDLFATGRDMFVLLNAGNGTFLPATAYDSGGGVALAADFDHDGRTNLVAVSYDFGFTSFRNTTCE